MDADELFKYGKFTFWQKLKLAGTGSEKLIYKSGIVAFDRWINFNQDDNYCSIEIYPKGFICRYQAAIQRQAAVGFLYNEIEKIEINAALNFLIITTKNEQVHFKILNKRNSLQKFIWKLKAQMN